MPSGVTMTSEVSVRGPTQGAGTQRGEGRADKAVAATAEQDGAAVALFEISGESSARGSSEIQAPITAAGSGRVKTWISKSPGTSSTRR